MTIENQRFEDVYPMNHCDFPLPCWFSDGVSGWWLNRPVEQNHISQFASFPECLWQKRDTLEYSHSIYIYISWKSKLTFC